MRMTESKLRRIIRSVIRETAEAYQDSAARLSNHNTDQRSVISGVQYVNYVLSMENMMKDIDKEYYSDYGFSMKGNTIYFGKKSEPNRMAVVTDIVEKCSREKIDEETCIRACNDEYTHGGGMYRIS